MQPITDPFSLPVGALPPERLAWLCQPEQIEHTLALLLALRSWQHASQLLLADDRPGLAQVIALVLAHASQRGQIQPIASLDGTAQFPTRLLLASAATDAARNALMHLRSLHDPAIWPSSLPQGDRLYQRFLRPLMRRVTGRDFPLVAEAVESLERAPVRAFLDERLTRLVQRAQQTRQPIPLRALSRLCIAPVDLLPIRENRWYFFDDNESWSNLDQSDLRQLDPEGASEIAWQYRSQTAEYVFHLPLRQVAGFLPVEQLHALPRQPGVSQERGVIQDHVLSEAEGLDRPADTILRDLGVEIARVCPHRLVDKRAYLARPAIRDLRWPGVGHDGDDWSDDPWDGLILPPSAR